jgi:hypothetical protein
MARRPRRRRRSLGNPVLRLIAEERDARRSGRGRLRSKLVPQVTFPGDQEVQARTRRREKARGVDEVFNALLADKPAGRDHDRPVAEGQLAAHVRSNRRTRREPIGVHAVGYRSRAGGVRTERRHEYRSSPAVKRRLTEDAARVVWRA